VAKKRSKRPNLSQETLERARAEMRGDRIQTVEADEPETTNGTMASASGKPKIKRPAAVGTRRVPTTQELVAEYSYVLRDLRNLLILAGLLMAVIIVLAIVLPRSAG
jgi:hypothetical protein